MNGWLAFAVTMASLALAAIATRSRGIALRENRGLKRVAQSRFVVYRNPDGGNGPLGDSIVDMTFESMYLIAKYGGMEARENYAYTLATAYGTMTIAIDMPKDTDGGHL